MTRRTCPRCRLWLPGQAEHETAEQCVSALRYRLDHAERVAAKATRRADRLSDSLTRAKAQITANKEYIAKLKGPQSIEARLARLEAEIAKCRLAA